MTPMMPKGAVHSTSLDPPKIYYRVEVIERHGDGTSCLTEWYCDTWEEARENALNLQSTWRSIKIDVFCEPVIVAPVYVPPA